MTFGLGNPLRVAALTLCLAATSPAADASAAPSHGVAKAVFKVTVDGVQRTSWKTDHPGTTGCDGARKGTGTETVRFTSRPVLVRATTMKGLSAPVLNGRSYIEPEAILRGRVSRQGTMEVAAGGECGGGDGTSIPRDCGTRSFRGVGVRLSYRLNAKPKDQLDLRPGFVDDPYQELPLGGTLVPNARANRRGEPHAHGAAARGAV